MDDIVDRLSHHEPSVRNNAVFEGAAEIARLRELVAAAYREGWGDSHELRDANAWWEDSEARAALQSANSV